MAITAAEDQESGHEERYVLRLFNTVDPAFYIYDRARGEVPTRGDIDAASFLPPEVIPHPSENYTDMHAWETAVTERQKVQAIMKALLKSRSSG